MDLINMILYVAELQGLFDEIIEIGDADAAEAVHEEMQTIMLILGCGSFKLKVVDYEEGALKQAERNFA